VNISRLKAAVVKLWIWRLAAWALGVVPLYFGLKWTIQGHLGPNPVEFLEHYTGDWTIRLLLTTLGVGLMWTTHYHQRPIMAAPILDAPVAGLAHALTLRAVPTYLDILPLYIVLLAAFPLVYAGMRKKTWLTLSVSAAIWLAANLDGNLNLPNWIGGRNWFFDPFAWRVRSTRSRLSVLVAT